MYWSESELKRKVPIYGGKIIQLWNERYPSAVGKVPIYGGNPCMRFANHEIATIIKWRVGESPTHRSPVGLLNVSAQCLRASRYL